MKLKYNTKISIIVIIAAIGSYFILVNVGSYNFATLTSPVEFENISISSITPNDVMIVGGTAVPVNCNVGYGTDGNFSNFASDNDLMKMSHTEHSVTISGLESDTKYNYQFVAEYDAKVYRSNMGVFQTAPSDAPMSLLSEQ